MMIATEMPGPKGRCSIMLGGEDRVGDTFDAFAIGIESRLHGAFVSAYGHERGREATAEALAYAWEHWARVEHLDNPLAYLYKVGQSRVRSRKIRVLYARPNEDDAFVEPGLPSALAALPRRQRQAVILVYAEGWTLKEVGDLLGLAVPTVQKHAERGIQRLRMALKVDASEMGS
jgi:RNA polymerase sigma factor (sigma-70 family)